jgi:hypothetical protein
MPSHDRIMMMHQQLQLELAQRSDCRDQGITVHDVTEAAYAPILIADTHGVPHKAATA